MKSIEIKAKTVDEAVEQGLKELGSTRENTEIEVINRGGMFSSAQVKLTLKETPATKATDFVNQLLSLMGFNASAAYQENADGIEVKINGSDSVNAIGFRGETLDALQYLTLIVANKGEDTFQRISVNTEGYREKREATLGELAEKLACKAERLNKKIQLEPMNPFERRAIHTALQNSDIATSESEGEEPNRYVIITPKNFVPSGRGNDIIKNGPRDDRNQDRPYRSFKDNFNKDGFNRDRGDRGSYNRDRGDRSSYNRGGRDNFNRDRRENYQSEPRAERTVITSDTEQPSITDFKKKGMPRTRSFGPKKKGF